ncbi:lysylphosphatidylglycerol synthase transmembrane domain-containing protein [Halocatena marina]|uniref:Lysylphosphatidylglycerol synthase transmembrane domain-containing protein n=1 Tax=Halocatena marina TaxID=2934937 RepID=A0ABD5YHZ3_9EURY|nr:lysylphosphatidylglycerol synthase transmembrane domain-containing protein [Halocatena marina]
MKRSYRWALKIVQYAIGIAALVWLVRQAEWGRVIGLIDKLDYITIVVILAATVAETLFRFSMWHVLLNGLRSTPFSIAARSTLIINFVNQILPSRISGRSIAPVVLRHYTQYDWSEVVTVAGLHTALYAILNGLIALLGLVLFAHVFSPGLIAVLGGSTALYLVVGFLTIVAAQRLDGMAAVAVRARELFGRIPFIETAIGAFMGKLPTFSEGVADTFKNLLSNYRVVSLYTAGWIASRMLFPGLRAWVLLTALDVEFSPLLLPVVLVTAYSVTLLPLTPGGIGVAEASATLVFTALGIPAAIITPVILVDRFLGVYLPSLAGWYPVTRIDLSGLATGEK